MTDVFSKQKRSEIMSAIRSTGNASTEIAMAVAFRVHRVTGWRRHLPIVLPACRSKGLQRAIVRPDFVFSAHKVAVFIDGDFWHGNPRRYRPPTSNADYWTAKIKRNRQRDRKVDSRLNAKGWGTIHIWESTLKKRAKACVERVTRALAQK
jgi:DNA mismatch endonuclease (patch repair protein)